MSSMKIRKAVIPVAGLGTRFLPSTKSIPKEMIPIIDTPMIQYIVEEAVRSGIEHIVLITSRHKEAIENHFDYHEELEEHLQRKQKKELADLSRSLGELCELITIRQKRPLGLGHAVLCAAPVIGDEPFAILLGDDLIDTPAVPCTRQLIEIYESKQASVVAAMEVASSELCKYGVVGGELLSSDLMHVLRLVEKPTSPSLAPSNWVIPGRYVLSPKIFDCLRRVVPNRDDEIQLTDGLQLLAQQEKLLAYQFRGKRYDTGDRIGLIDATLAFALKRETLAPAVRALMRKYLEEASDA